MHQPDKTKNVLMQFSFLSFKQIRGVPMGGNCSPLLADQFLLHCECVFMKNLVANEKFCLAKLLSFTTRYIDDLCIVNCKHFETLLALIYPHDLVAERSGNDCKSIDYLDVKVNIREDGLHASVYRKVDAFPFEVILFTSVGQ